MSTRQTIVTVFEDVAASQSIALKPLADDVELLESGLDSLCFAIIIAKLEDSLGLDPFSDAEEAYFPVTFGEFVALYER